jgi:hypothetical protein
MQQRNLCRFKESNRKLVNKLVSEKTIVTAGCLPNQIVMQIVTLWKTPAVLPEKKTTGWLAENEAV